jgi:hypothetical protein
MPVNSGRVLVRSRGHDDPAPTLQTHQPVSRGEIHQLNIVLGG